MNKTLLTMNDQQRKLFGVNYFFTKFVRRHIWLYIYSRKKFKQFESCSFIFFYYLFHYFYKAMASFTSNYKIQLN